MTWIAIPLASLTQGALAQIVLSTDNWHVFDTLYTRAGDSVTVQTPGGSFTLEIVSLS